ncbi:MAG: GNAT family N-acetyltransferase [Lentisphaeria bacterium]|nr:GNAT family N-acetyltransferase [Lentisphaeria bacterium]NQZ67565.1 GNAT family N-acetyltransferase [Lentisphaeria bacterium]
MDIVNLKDARQHVDRVAAWHHAEWLYLNPDDTIDKRIQRMEKYYTKNAIPTMLVSLTDGLLTGTAALVETDMKDRLDLGPWLASVYVDTASRKQGIGRKLVRAIMDYAEESHIGTLYLFTPDQQQFYRNMGWQDFEDCNYRGTDVTIMSYNIN